ncbi:MAG: IclR family transcriptional regulator [Burkholderiales bacterium]|jgi:DNA-binding IclR family transcriptional regulator
MAAGVEAVERALGILAVFRAGDEGLTLAELARRTGYYKSTILRLIVSLERHGYMRRLADGRYAVGAEPARLAQLYQSSFRVGDIVVPLLHRLAKQSGETASFYVRDGNARMCLHRVEPARAVRIFLREGDRLPLDRGASGKVLRACAAAAPKGDSALAQIRAQLWGASFGERDPDTASVAAPVFGADQELIGALALAGPRERFTEAQVKAFARLLHGAAARATAALGGDASVFAMRRNKAA